VVASRPEDGDPAECLAALEPQRDDETEVLVASAGGRAPGRSGLTWAGHVEAPADASVPRLWGLGLSRARGEVVAFTTTQFRPSPDWLAEIRASHARLDAAGIGGPVEPPPTESAFDWAVFFLRYSAYLAHEREAAVPDLAGDNASYKRAALLAIGAGGDGEFWEQEAHRRLLARGERLVFVPGMRVRQVGSFPAGVFLRQRLRHGRRFGTDRASRHGRIWRMAALGASPLIPAVLLGKVALRVLRSRRHAGRLLLALPALAACTGAWAAGEARGYLGALRA
jgi:hypothetical protein